MKTRRASVKRTPVTSSVADAISYAYGEISSLHDEIEEAVSGMEDSPGLAATSRCQTLAETRDTLSEHTDEPDDVPDMAGEIEVSYTENREKRLTRAGRRDNASGALSACVDALNSWADEREEEVRDRDGEDDGGIDEARELASSLQETIDAIDGVEFPGMYG